jgi:hypothetical protein
VLSRIPDTQLTGHPTQRLPNNASFVFSHVEGESILLSLDVRGIYASSASACTSGSIEPSHVIAALGLPPEATRGSLRLTTGMENTVEQIDEVLAELPRAIETLRAMSPSFAPLPVTVGAASGAAATDATGTSSRSVVSSSTAVPSGGLIARFTGSASVAGSPQAAQWERIEVVPGIELHVRQPISPARRRAIAAYIARARNDIEGIS